MAAITAAAVKELREITGVAMMDCKKALGETDGMIKTVFDATTGELLGAHMVGAEVTELIQGYVVGKQIMAANPGNAKMQEIAEAMQELEQFDLQAMTMEGKEATLPAATPDIR